MSSMHLRIRAARKRTKLSQENFAAEIGVSRGAVAQWEMQAGTSPSVKNIEAIALCSGCAFEWVATGRGPKILGEPQSQGVRDDAANYAVDLSDEESLMVRAMRGMNATRRKALCTLFAEDARKPR